MARELLHSLNVRNFNAQLDPSDLRLLKLAYGADGVRYFFRRLRGELFNIDDELLDSVFFERLTNELGEPFTHGHFLTALGKANETHMRVVESLGLPPWNAGLINNVYAFSESPSERLKIISSPRTSPLLRHQLSNQLLLALIHAHLDSRNRNNRLRTVLNRFVQFTDEVFFPDQLIGKNEVIHVFSTHDDQNRVQRLNIGREFMSLSNGESLQKKTPLRIRESSLGGHKFIFGLDIRRKDDAAGVLKALTKAIKNGGNIRPHEYVNDVIGAKFVVAEGDINSLVIIFENFVREYYGNIEVEADDSPDFGRHQSNRHTFRRRQLHLGDATIEVLFYSLREFIDSQYDVGVEDEDGFFNGAAHDLYEIKRIVDAARVLFPKEMYGFNVRDYWPLKQMKVVEELFRKNSI
jgi:hypothetical protein